jgi:serine/threonine/tyrosine protein kinase RAD53
LGEGAFSRVYECVEIATGDTFAVKIVDFRRWQLLRSFSVPKVLREASIMQTLEHASIVKLKFVHHTSSALWLVQELAEGSELFQVIVREGKLSEVRAT